MRCLLTLFVSFLSLLFFHVFVNFRNVVVPVASRSGEVLPETTEQYPTEDGEEEDEEQEYIVDEWYDGDLRAILVLDEITEYFDEVSGFTTPTT